MQASDEKISLIFLKVKKQKVSPFNFRFLTLKEQKTCTRVSAPGHTKLFLAPPLCQCCRRHCTLGVTDLWQATSALLGLVREPAQAPHASQCSSLVSVTMEILLLTGQNISCFCLLLCKTKGTATWKGGESPPGTRSLWHVEGKSIRLSICCCTKAEFWEPEGTSALLLVFLVPFLPKQLFYQALPTEIWKEPSLSTSQYTFHMIQTVLKVVREIFSPKLAKLSKCSKSAAGTRLSQRK